MNKNTFFLFACLMQVSCIITMDSTSSVSSLSSNDSINNTPIYELSNKFETLDHIQNDIQQNYLHVDFLNINPLNIYNYISLPIKERTPKKFNKLTPQEKMYTDNYFAKIVYAQHCEQLENLRVKLQSRPTLNFTDDEIISDVKRQAHQIKNINPGKECNQAIDQLHEKLNVLLSNNNIEPASTFQNYYYQDRNKYLSEQLLLHHKNNEYQAIIAWIQDIKKFDSAIVLQTFFRKKAAQKSLDQSNNINYAQKDLAENVSQVLNIPNRKDRYQAAIELKAKIEKLHNNNLEALKIEELYPQIIKHADGSSSYHGYWSNDYKEKEKYTYLEQQKNRGIYQKNKGKLIKNDLEYRHALSLLSKIEQDEAVITLQSFIRKNIAFNTVTKIQQAHELERNLKLEQERTAEKLRREAERKQAQRIIEETKKEAQRKANQDALAAKKAKEQEETAKQQQARQAQSARDKAKREAKIAAEKAQQDHKYYEQEMLQSGTKQEFSLLQTEPAPKQSIVDTPVINCKCTPQERYKIWLDERNEIKQTLEKSLREKYANKPPKGKKLTKNDLEKKIKAEVIQEFKKIAPGDEIVFQNLQAYAEELQPNMSMKSFIALEMRISEIDTLLASKGQSLAWYLASNPDLYTTIKTKHLDIQKKADGIDLAALEDNYNKLIINACKNTQITTDKKSVAIFQQNKLKGTQLYIADKVKALHAKHGILDVAYLLYPEPTAEMFNDTDKLSPGILQQAENLIKDNLLRVKNNDDLLKGIAPKPWYMDLPPVLHNHWSIILYQESYYDTIKPIIKALLLKIEYPVSQNQIKTIIRTSIIDGLKSQDTNNISYLTQKIRMETLKELYYQNELTAEPVELNVLIELAKIYACAIKATISIIHDL